MDPEISEWSSRLSQSHLWRGRLGPFPLSFHRIDLVWGPHLIDHVANHLNAKPPRFNSRFSNPGAEGIDAFVMDWAGENNYVCLPICLILRVLLHMCNCKAAGSGSVCAHVMSCSLWRVATQCIAERKSPCAQWKEVSYRKSFFGT